MELVGDGAGETRMRAAINHVRMQVNPENILQVRKLFLEEAERVLAFVTTCEKDTEYVGLCGGDPLSPEAADALNRRIRHELLQARRYGSQLESAGRSLERTAREYGYTEAQIKASLPWRASEDRS